jgi:hypothetical protein
LGKLESYIQRQHGRRYLLISRQIEKLINKALEFPDAFPQHRALIPYARYKHYASKRSVMQIRKGSLKNLIK